MSTPAHALLLENIHENALAPLIAAGCRVTRLNEALTPAALRARLADVQILGIRSKSQIDVDLIQGAPGLQSIGCFCIGTNQVDLQAANRAGVPVFNAPLSNTRSVAELVLSELVALARQLGDRSREMHAGHWNKTAEHSYEVRGKTLGIVGYGHIGAQLGVMAEALGLRVIFYDILTQLPLGNNRPMASLDALLRAADFVSLHVPATPQTQQMIGAAQLAMMPAGSYLLNLSRGSVVDLSALAAALRAGHLRGAAVDVFPDEPERNQTAFHSPLHGLPNVLLTPHIGGATEEAQAAIGIEVATQLGRFMTAGTTLGAVNFPRLELPPAPTRHRLLNVHRNVPGVMRDVNQIVGALSANIHAQVLATDQDIGYFLMDLDQDLVDDVAEALTRLPNQIRTRVLPQLRV